MSRLTDVAEGRCLRNDVGQAGGQRLNEQFRERTDGAGQLAGSYGLEDPARKRF